MKITDAPQLLIAADRLAEEVNCPVERLRRRLEASVSLRAAADTITQMQAILAEKGR